MRNRFDALAAALVLALVPLPTLAQSPSHRIQITDHQTIDATMSFEVHTTKFATERWMLFLPEPPELPSQTNIKTTTDPAGTVITEKSPLARKLIFIDKRVARPVFGSSITVRQRIQATLRSRELIPMKPGEKSPVVERLSAAEMKHYLAPSKQIDFDKRGFKDWLDAKKLHRGRTESPLVYAARVLTVLRSDFGYRYNPADEKRASITCSKSDTDCGGLTFLFVAAMRAHDIPARVLIGRFAKSRKPGSTPADNEYYQPHVRSEMFVADIGWIPVDPLFANRDKRRPVERYLGFDPGDMLVLHIDLGLRLPAAGKVFGIEDLQVAPSVFALGRGTLDLMPGATSWVVKTAPRP